MTQCGVLTSQLCTMFALIDCNNFYASCHRVFQPKLLHQPIVVLSNNDGCVISRSAEAKLAGIPMGAPAHQFQRVFEQKKIKFFSSNYQLYADMSNRVMSILSLYSPDQEIYSIDECFLKLNGFDRFDLKNYGLEIKSKIYQFTKLPVCVGIAPTKSLAKLANHIAKKFPEVHQGVYVIQTQEQIHKALKWLNIEDVWGIGRRMSRRLRMIGVNKALDFVQLKDDFLRKEFSIVGLRLKKDLLGEAVLDLEAISAKKSIATTRSFEEYTNDFEYVKERVATFAVSCAEKLRKQNSSCNLVTVFIQTNNFDRNKPQYYRTISVHLPYESNSSITLSKFAIKAFEQIYKDGYEYKKAGVVVSGIVSSDQKQLSLFEEENPNHPDLMKVIDLLNKKFGAAKIKLASQDLNKTWKMRQNNLSPCYTTKWKDLLVVY